MVHTHQHRSLQLESRCVKDILANEVLSFETRTPHQEAPKRYEYRSFNEALKIPLFKSAYLTACKLYSLLRSKSCFCFCFLWFWKTFVVSLARLADSIFWVRLFMILVDSTIFRVITSLRQRYPVLSMEVNELTLAVKSSVQHYWNAMATNSKMVLSKLLATVRLNVITLMGFTSFCDTLASFLHKFERPVDCSSSEESNSGGYNARQQVEPVDCGLNNID